MNARTWLTWVLRESRGARAQLWLMVLGVAVGVAAVVAVGTLGGALREGIFLDSRRLLAADVSVRSRQEFPPLLEELLGAESTPLARALVIEFPTVVAGAAPEDGAPPKSRLVEAKVVEPAYPLRGDLVLDPPRPLGELLEDRGAVISPDLAQALDLAVGSSLRFGETELVVRGLVLEEPDRTNFALALGPRLFAGHSAFAESGLDQFGARLERKLLLALPDDRTAEDARALGLRLRQGLRTETQASVNTWADAQPALRRGIERVESFLALTALLALVLGALAAGLCARSFLESRVDSIALQKCLGLERRTVGFAAAAQIAALALLGAVLGASVGAGAARLALGLYQDLLPPNLSLPWIAPWPLAYGLLLGVSAALAAALSPLLAAVSVPPLWVLRRDGSPLKGPRQVGAVAALAAIALLFAAAWAESGSMPLAGLFTAGLAVSCLGLYGLSRLLLRGARRLPPELLAAPLRFGVASLTRPNHPGRGALLALGVGVFAVGALFLVQRRLLAELNSALPPDAPSAFFLGLVPEQREQFFATVGEVGAVDVRSAPMVMGRLRQVDGAEVRDLLNARERGEGQRRSRWVLTREQRMTFGPELPADNRLLRGSLWSDPERAEVSIEEGFAEDLGVDVGSVLTMDVQGVPVELWVTSVRAVRWESLGINFFLHVEPGVLEEAPQMVLATARLPEGGAQLAQDLVSARFPGVTLIDVGDLRRRLAGLFTRAGQGVSALGSLCLAAGLVVFLAALLAAGRERRREAGLLRALGSSRKTAILSLASEYAVLGAVSGLVGGAAASAVAYGIFRWVLELDGAAALWAAPAAALLLACLAALAGSFAALRALRTPPAEVLAGR